MSSDLAMSNIVIIDVRATLDWFSGLGGKRMRQRKIGWGAVGALLLTLLCALGLAAVGGKARGLLVPSLTADVVIAAFPLPEGMGLDADEISSQLANVIQKKAEEDVGLRLALGGGAQQKLQDIVLPRLFAPQSVRGILREVPALAAVLSVGEVRRSAVVSIHNRGGPIGALALTTPGIVLAEADGAGLDIVTSEAGLTAVDLGPIQSGQRKSVTLWLDSRAEVPPADLARLVQLGVEGKKSGLVRIAGGAGWNGSDLEVLPWARWIILTVLTMGLVTGLIGIFAAVAGATRRPGRV